MIGRDDWPRDELQRGYTDWPRPDVASICQQDLEQHTIEPNTIEFDTIAHYCFSKSSQTMGIDHAE